MKTILAILMACLLAAVGESALAAATTETSAAAKASAAKNAAATAAEAAKAEATTAEEEEALAAKARADAAAEAARTAKDAAAKAVEAARAAKEAEAAAKAAKAAKEAKAKEAAKEAAAKEEVAKKATAEAEKRGSISCNDWLDDRSTKAGQAGKTPAASWLLGFLSGIAVAKDRDFFSGTKNEALFDWVDKYCASHTLEYTSDAGIHLYLDLARKKGMLE